MGREQEEKGKGQGTEKKEVDGSFYRYAARVTCFAIHLKAHK